MKIDYDNIKSQSEYQDKMGLVGKSTKIATAYSEGKTWKIDLTDVIDGKNEAAYKEACENRRFEIEMHWKRAGYFWAFIVSIYTAVFFISGKEGQNIARKEAIKLALAFLGFVFCMGFYLANKGSKNWQENWEQHVNLLEDNVSGQLYKIFIRDEPAYSVSKINEFLSFVLAIFSGGFFVVQTVDFLKCHTNKTPLQLLSVFIIIIAFALLVFIYMKCCLLGNQAGSKEFNFVNAKMGD